MSTMLARAAPSTAALAVVLQLEDALAKMMVLPSIGQSA
jgi:hypothetical protein